MGGKTKGETGEGGRKWGVGGERERTMIGKGSREKRVRKRNAWNGGRVIGGGGEKEKRRGGRESGGQGVKMGEYGRRENENNRRAKG